VSLDSPAAPEGEDPEDTIADLTAAPGETAASATANADGRRVLDEMVATLPPRLQTVVRARFIAGESLEATGKRLGITKQGVHRLEQIALDRLRTKLEERGIGGADDVWAPYKPAPVGPTVTQAAEIRPEETRKWLKVLRRLQAVLVEKKRLTPDQWRTWDFAEKQLGQAVLFDMDRLLPGPPRDDGFRLEGESTQPEASGEPGGSDQGQMSMTFAAPVERPLPGVDQLAARADGLAALIEAKEQRIAYLSETQETDVPPLPGDATLREDLARLRGQSSGARRER